MKRLRRYIAGLLAFVMVMTNVCANVTTAWAAEGGVGDAAPSGGDTVEVSLHIGDSLYLPDLVEGEDGEWEYDADTAGQYVDISGNGLTMTGKARGAFTVTFTEKAGGLLPPETVQEATAQDATPSNASKTFRIRVLPESSGDLGDFLVAMEVYQVTGDTTRLVVRTGKDGEILEKGEGKLIKDGEYRVVLQFREPEQQAMLFRAATPEELAAAGISEYPAGEWMYVLLGDIDASKIGRDQEENGNVKVVNGGKALLFRFQTDASGNHITYCDITFTGNLDENADLGNIQIVHGSSGGTIEFEPETAPSVEKEAGQYRVDADAGQHRIPYTITVANPESGTTISSITVTDTIQTPGAKLAAGTVKVDETPVSDHMITVKEDGSGFTIKDYPANLAPGGKIVITYEVDVNDLLEKLGSSAAAFNVNNTVEVWPDGAAEPLTDDESSQVYLGKLTKSGGYPITWYDNPELIYWWITAYDPYLGLDDKGADRVLSDVMPEQIGQDDIVGIQFMTSVKGNDGNLLSYPFFKVHQDKNYTIGRLEEKGVLSYGENNGHTVLKFDLVKLAELSNEIGMNLFETEDHKNLEIGIYTNQKGNGYYENHAKITLPSEIVERDAEAHINIGPRGVDVEKTGKLNSDGKKLDYTVTMYVGDHIEDGTGYFNGQAMIHDVMSIQISSEKECLFDVSNGIEIKSVVATYKDGGEDWTWEFTADSNAPDGHKYELYKVHQIGYGTGNEWLSADTYQDISVSSETCLFFNPEETEIEWWNKRVQGHWPDELNNHDVTVTINYTIDPEYAYFIDVENGSWVKKAYNGCDTLAAYLEKEEDVVVHNTVTGSVKGSSDADYFDLNLTKPLKKDGELKTDPAISQKRAAYTVTFHNGLDNDSAIPRGADNIVFKDRFDSKMVYVSGSLKAQLKKTTGELTEFTYIGDQDTLVQGGVLTASWSDFKTTDGQTLQQNFKGQSAHYQYIFTYELEPGKSFPQKVNGEYAARIPIDNEAWLEFDGGALAHVNEELQFPTGVLAKGAVIEGDKVAFYVEINEESQDLSAGELIVKDDPSNHDDLEIVADSITVEEYTDDGMKLLVKGTDYKEEMSANGAFTLHLPDETHLRVRYEYALKPEAKSKAKVSITNKVNIEGKSLLEDGQTWEFETSSIGADFGGSKASLTLKKVRKDTQKPVPGAQFILYVPNPNGTATDEAKDAAEAINKKSIIYNGKLSPVAVYETGSDGEAQIDWELLSTGVTYALAEYQVPGGYRKLKDPVIFRIERIGERDLVRVLKGSNDLIKTEGNVLTVSNEYGVEFTPKVKKEITGDPVPADQKENFKFKLSAVSGNPAGGAAYNGAEIADGSTDVAEITVQGAGTGSFEPITFTEPGTYSFEITEMKGENPSYSYDEAVWTLAVTVADQNGELTVTGHTYAAAGDAAGNEEAAAFTNIYTPAPVKTAIGVKKTVTGEVPAGTDPDFTFKLLQPEPAAEGVELPGSLEVTAKAGESKSFGDIEFTKAGTYVFEVTETAGTQPGYTYDGSKYSISITVEDQAGQLTVAKREITRQQSDGTTETLAQPASDETLTVEFTNQYKAAETGYAPQVVKAVAGDTAPKTETFAFTLEADAANPEGGAVLSESATAARTTVEGAGTASFDEITFKKAGTYRFTIKEDAGSEKGWIYDEAVWTLTVTVADQNGKLEVTGHTYAAAGDAAGNEEAAAFTNTYTAPGKLTIRKTVGGSTGERERDFNFTVTLTDAEGQPLAGSYPYSGSSSEQDVAAPAGGTVENGSLSVTLRHGQQITIEDLPAGTRYTVSETEADTEDYTTTVTVDGAARTGDAEGTVTADAGSTVVYLNSRGGTTPGDNPGDNPPPPGTTEIPENPTPTGTPPIENITDEPTPLSSQRELENIEDEDVPLAFMAPMTGDETPTGAAALFGLMALGMMGAFGILASRKEEDEA